MTTKKLKRVESAKERQVKHDSLTTAQKIIKLDLKFGKDQGAKKERTKLLAKEAEEKYSKTLNKLEDKPKEEKKPYQKPKKS